ncbi:hypothetical protein ACQX0N_09895 [Clostridium tepidum]|jgi:hypothetical protein|uniref:Uncharacterized protein n=1 Tax=Clostridium tepidum TaxID=1962263 RepID=A0ABX3L3T2_9CLOT|nr:hypothetical protein [Clostridium tepidum]OOO62032.1 hypothetical protein BS637_09550 [Clostridium tepidum]
MKNLYEFLEEKYEQFEEEMTLDEFIESFINENFGIGALSEGLLDDEFLFYYEKSYRLDHQDKKIEFLFEEVKF